jgi:putative membrane protein
MRFVLRWAITAAAVAVAAWLIPGISVTGSSSHQAGVIIVVAAVLGLVNAFIRPIVSALSCGLIVLTLGLFTLVINGLMLWLASYISEHGLGVGFQVNGFWSAFWGAIIISIVSLILSTFVGKKRLERR